MLKMLRFINKYTIAITYNDVGKRSMLNDKQSL